MKFGFPGVIETYLPPYLGSAIKQSNTFYMSHSILILYSLVIAPGKGYLFKFLPVLTLIDTGGNPNLAKSKIPSSGKPSTPSKLQLFTCLVVSKFTLWYYSKAFLKNG